MALCITGDESKKIQSSAEFRARSQTCHCKCSDGNFKRLLLRTQGSNTKYYNNLRKRFTFKGPDPPSRQLLQ